MLVRYQNALLMTCIFLFNQIVIVTGKVLNMDVLKSGTYNIICFQIFFFYFLPQQAFAQQSFSKPHSTLASIREEKNLRPLNLYSVILGLNKIPVVQNFGQLQSKIPDYTCT
jgi:hypothetical protein